jgi:glutamine amidotransferase-like uncharacterized protein
MSLALIYSGPGVELPRDVPDGTVVCMQAVATLAGFATRLVEESTILTDADFAAASVWLTPGADEQRGRNGYHGNYKANAIGAFLRTQGYDRMLKAAIQAGLGYLGCCAGAWVAQEPYGLARLLEAQTASAREPQQCEMFMADGTTRNMVWMGGPRFTGLGSSVTVIANYGSRVGSVGIVSGRFGRGRVWLSGPHPEAETTWIESGPPYPAADRDSNREYLADQMLRVARV